MLLKWPQILSVVIFAAVTSLSHAAENSRILFSNPLVRETASVPQLQALKFVTVDEFAPFSAFDATGNLRGVHVDLARAICAELKITTGCTLQAVSFDDVENLLISGQADVALAGLVATSQNRKNLSFGVPYFRYASKFLVKTDSALKNGALIGVIKDSAHQKIAEILFSQFKQKIFSNDAEAFAALQSGTVSALFGDGLRLALMEDDVQMLDCCRLQAENYFLPALRPDTLNAAFSNSRNDILIAVDTALRKIAADGQLDEIYLRHMPVNPLK